MCIGFIVKLWFKLKSSKTMENKSKKLIKESEKTTWSFFYIDGGWNKRQSYSGSKKF